MKLVILDRDGVINHDSPDFVKTPQEWVALPGSLDAIARLSRAGWRVVIASNQSGIARRLFSMESLNAIHAKLRRELGEAGGVIDAIFVCPHAPQDECLCRKPRPGLIHDIVRRYEVPSATLSAIPVVGDSLRDLIAAHLAGCAPVLVRTGNGLQTLKQGGLPPDVQVYDDLAAVATALLQDPGE